ncbi:hypothetical protein V6N11_071239 [Hibiscus sabdariffa]|uniref:Large ribosomal subunit protein uL18c n=1 Tax=Hibiscus sabdariffa TaxID=183260 RepID=A0ABR2TZJ3_9ROSI
MEAEFVSCFEATSHGVWLKSFISGLRLVNSISRPLKIHCDNLAVVFMAKNNKSESRSKHIDIKYLAIRERVKEKKVTSFLGLPLTLSLPDPHLSFPSRSLSVEAKACTRTEDHHARHSRIRKKVEGTPDRPRLCVFRSNKHLYVQIIDDLKMHTLASASTMQKPVSEEFDYSSSPTIEVAKKVGESIAKSCLEKGITKVAFDRGGYPYHGRIQALANSARENGLQF